MANFHKEVLLGILGKRTDIQTAIETGTADARTTLLLADFFDPVHTIELSDDMYELAKKNIDGFPEKRKRIQMHRGDSAEELPSLLVGINEPVFFYLDAHYCEGYDGKAADSEMPLFKELEAIAKRKFNDIIVVDDVHAFLGQHEISRDKDWKNVHPMAIKEVFNLSEIAEAYQINDQYVLKMHNRI